MIYVRARDIIDSPVGNDFVALDARRGQCVGMEGVSAEVWRLLSMPVTIEQICTRLISTYDVDEARCRAEVQTLLDEMIAARLVETRAPTRN